MQRFTGKIVGMMKQENLYASHGGPIILSQIENEYGNIDGAYGSAAKSYINWVATMATSLDTGVPWVMCQQKDAPDPIPPRFDDKETAERVASPGLSVGLVWTAFGGEVQFVEATAMVGKGELHLTGQLGDVIKESAQIALTWVRARAADLMLAATEEINLLEGRDIHIHFPAGAVPKDGPSAGVTLVTSLVSLFSHKRVRADTAMTGEMTLRGLVLPVGGIKDKVLAAHRYGIKRVILPERNLKDLVEVPSAVLANLEILLVKRMEDVLEHAFEGGCPWRQHSKL